MDETTPQKDLTRETLIRYLLGDLPEAEADALEVRLLTDQGTDDQMQDAVQEAEYKLIDLYARNLLSPAQRALFESHYLASPLHRERAATALHLTRAADATPVTQTSRQPAATDHQVAWWRTLFATPTVAWSTVLAIAILGALVIWLLLERGRLQQQLQAQQQRTQGLENEIAQLRQTSEQLLARGNATPAPILPSTISKIELRDGGQLIALDAQGQLRGAERFSEAEQNWLRQTLQTERLPEAPPWMDLRVPKDELMGGGSENSFALQQPLSQALLTATPTLRWQALPAAETYRVEIYDMNFQRIVVSKTLQTTSWQVRPALPAGKAYQWQVMATRKGEEIQAPTPPAPPARFAVIAASEAAAIAQARQRQPVPHLLLATLYARNALYTEAENELLALQKANPNSAQIKQMLVEVHRRARQSAPTKTKPAQ